MTDDVYMAHRAFEQQRWADSPTTDCEGMLLIVERDGPIWTLACDQCRFEAGLPARDADPLLVERWRRQLVDSRRHAAGIPQQLKGLGWHDVADVRHDVLADARSWAAGRSSGLLLSGGVGVGKTTLAAVAAWARLEHEPLQWFLTSNLIEQLQLNFEDDARQEAMSTLIGNRGLVLDDIDKLNPTPNKVQYLLELVDNRVAAGAPLLVTANLDLNGLAAKYGDPIASRLVGYCAAFALEGQDRRLERRRLRLVTAGGADGS